MLMLSLIAIAYRGFEYPIAVHHPGSHTVHHLLGIFLTLVRGDRGQQVLDKAAIRVLGKLNRGTFEFAARAANGGAELDMGFDVTGQTADIIDNHHMRLLALVLVQEGQHFLNFRAIQQRTGDTFIVKDLNDFIFLVGGELTAPGFL